MRREYLNDHCHHYGGAHNLIPFDTKLLKFPLKNRKLFWDVQLLDKGIHQNENYSRIQIHYDENLSHAGY